VNESLGKNILPISNVVLCILNTCKIEEMRSTVNFMVKFLRICQHEVIFSIRIMLHSHEVEVPGPTVRYHEES